jgi:hypothetical protein
MNPRGSIRYGIFAAALFVSSMTPAEAFPPPWQVEQIAGRVQGAGYERPSLCARYARETQQQADIAKVLTFDGARRIALNVAKLPDLLGSRNGLR